MRITHPSQPWRKMMTEITRDFLRILRADLDAAVLAVAKKHGLTISTGNAKFSDQSATFQLLVEATPAEDGVRAKDVRAAKDLADLGGLYGANPEWAGKSFTLRGARYSVIGLLPNRTKNCILARRADGKDFIMPPETVRLGLGR
jgi:hypothetical protein